MAGESSYSTYDKAIEIEIDTKEEYRRRGGICVRCKTDFGVFGEGFILKLGCTKYMVSIY